MADAENEVRDNPLTALSFEESIGYQVRLTHRLIQRSLGSKIRNHGISLGMWYFLRALWDRDGLTQRELSEIVGTMEPTTFTALKAMEQSGLVRRARNADDKRKVNIFLTKRGQALKDKLLPLAIEVIDVAGTGLSRREKESLLDLLKVIQGNLRQSAIEEFEVE